MLRNENELPGILFSTSNTIIFAEINVDVTCYKEISNSQDLESMKHVATVRGYNNHFFFVDQDRNSDVECIFDLLLYYEDNEWHNEKALIY